MYRILPDFKYVSLLCCLKDRQLGSEGTVSVCTHDGYQLAGGAQRTKA